MIIALHSARPPGKSPTAPPESGFHRKDRSDAGVFLPQNHRAECFGSPARDAAGCPSILSPERFPCRSIAHKPPEHAPALGAPDRRRSSPQSGEPSRGCDGRCLRESSRLPILQNEYALRYARLTAMAKPPMRTYRTPCAFSALQRRGFRHQVRGSIGHRP